MNGAPSTIAMPVEAPPDTFHPIQIAKGPHPNGYGPLSTMRYLSQRILLAVSAVELDERLSRSVLLGLGGVVVEGRGDLLGKLLAQLDAPLVVGVDAPDRALDKRDVLVQGDELAECERGQRVTEDRSRRTVALKAAGRDDLLGRALGAHLIGRLTKGERLGLSQEVA